MRREPFSAGRLLQGLMGATLLTATACAPAGPPSAAPAAKPTTVAELAQYSGADRQQLLEAGARQEGKVLWYTSLIVDQLVRPIKQGFEKKYPFVTMEFFRANGPELIQRITTEYRAGRYDLDIVNGLDAVAVLKQAGIMQAFISPELATYAPNLKDPDGMWGSTYTTYHVFGYNTRLVPEAEAPRTYEDLLNPKWKGKLIWATSPSTGGPMFVGNVLKIMGEQKGKDYLNRLAQVGVRNSEASTRAILDQVIGGDFSVNVVSSLHHAVISKAQGAPVSWTEPEPIGAISDSGGLVKNAPHPHAALLLLDFLFSEEGQKLVVDSGYAPSRPGLTAKDPALLPVARGVKVNFSSGEELVRVGNEWQKLFEELFVH